MKLLSNQYVMYPVIRNSVVLLVVLSVSCII